MTESPSRLRISEIFFSLQGESTTVGCPTVFIRLTGCPLRCVYCDTSYAFSGGEWLDLDQIMQQVKQYSARYITVTGGEPLAQKACVELLRRLCDEAYKVSIETSGALDISAVDSRVKRVMDLKTPASGECEKNLYQNIDYLGPDDEVKFVISNRDDYQWSKQILDKYNLNERCEVLFSPVHGEISATDLADWIIEDGLAVRFQVQLHKYLWGDKPGH
ncbi:MAG: 7-carboxy-7-deazaguanine synthase QueE [Gammaproteobacteria bacterium]